MYKYYIDAKKIDIKAVVDHAAMKAAGLARGGKDGVRLLAKGELTSKVNFSVAGASKAAVEAVEKAGGKVEVLVKVSASEKAAAKKSSVKNAAKEAAAKKYDGGYDFALVMPAPLPDMGWRGLTFLGVVRRQSDVIFGIKPIRTQIALGVNPEPRNVYHGI